MAIEWIEDTAYLGDYSGRISSSAGAYIKYGGIPAAWDLTIFLEEFDRQDPGDLAVLIEDALRARAEHGHTAADITSTLGTIPWACDDHAGGHIAIGHVGVLDCERCRDIYNRWKAIEFAGERPAE